MMASVIPLWIIMLKAFGVYDSIRQKRFIGVLWPVFEASAAATLVFWAFAFLMKFDILSRTFFAIFSLTTLFLLTVEKWIMLFILREARRKGFNFRVLLIVGSGERAQRFANLIESHSEWGIRILGFIDEKEKLGMAVGGGRVIGTFCNLSRILDDNVVDEVVFIMSRKWLSQIEVYVKVCEKIGIKATIAVDFFETAIAKPVIRDVEGWPLLTFDTTPHDFFSTSLKRSLDIAGASLGLIILSPLFLFISVAIKTTSKGPVFFRQMRCGLNGRTFPILKFRTMVVGAEKKLQELKRLNELEGPVFKIRNDPRITVVGRVLRKSSLDELPRLSMC
jgi:hypothetical protein